MKKKIEFTKSEKEEGLNRINLSKYTFYCDYILPEKREIFGFCEQNGEKVRVKLWYVPNDDGESIEAILMYMLDDERQFFNPLHYSPPKASDFLRIPWSNWTVYFTGKPKSNKKKSLDKQG